MPGTDKKKSGIQINMSNRTGELNLSSAHSMLMGHIPTKVTAEQISKQLSEDSNTDVMSFGLWEQSTPNYTTYYPDVTAEDLNPKDEEFIEPVFRLLSAGIVSKGYRPIDFSKDGVLKKAMNMLLGQTVNIDHEVAVGNAIGAVSAVWWQDSYKTKSGVVVPAGINGKLKIDGKSNPRIARGILMNPPSIHSNSVTVRFKWEKSHDVDDDVFFAKLGQKDDKGNLYRLVVNEVMGFSETSLVSHGADMWAQKVMENGEIVNPEYGARQSFSADKETSFVRSMVEIDYKMELSFNADNTIPGKSNNNNNTDTNNLSMEQIIKNLQESFGFSEGELTADNLAEKLAEKNTENLTSIQNLTAEKAALETEKAALETEKAALETEKETLTSEVDNLKTQLEEATADANLIQTITENSTNEAVRLYKLAMEDQADENIIGLMAKADLKTSQSFIAQYQKVVDEKFGATCSDCGSKNVNRGSAEGSQDNLNNKGGQGSGQGSNGKNSLEVHKSLQAKKKRKSNLTGK